MAQAKVAGWHYGVFSAVIPFPKGTISTLSPKIVTICGVFNWNDSP